MACCVSHLNTVRPAGDGKVDAENDDEQQEADEEEELVLPAELHTCAGRIRKAFILLQQKTRTV